MANGNGNGRIVLMAIGMVIAALGGGLIGANTHSHDETKVLDTRVDEVDRTQAGVLKDLDHIKANQARIERDNTKAHDELGSNQKAILKAIQDLQVSH